MLDRVSQIVNFFHDDDYIDFMLDNGRRGANLAIKRAQKVGSEVDEYIRAELNGNKLPEVSDDALMALKGWDSYKRDFPSSKLKTLNRMIHHLVGFTGEIDALNGEELVDFKVATKIRASYFIQLGGYTILLANEGINVSKASIVRFDSRIGIYEKKSTTKIDELKNLFLSNLNLVRFWRGDFESDYFTNND